MVVRTTERLDVEPLRRAIMQAPHWWSSLKLMALLKLIEQLDSKGGMVEQVWAESMLGSYLGGGFRLYPQLPSVSTLSRQMRAIATMGMVCCDLENCHPTILTWLRPDIAAISQYVNDKESTLAATMAHYSITRDEAKQLYLQLLFKGKLTSWSRNNNIDRGLSPFPFAIEFEKAVATVARQLTTDYPEMFDKIERYRDESGARRDPEATLLSYVLQRFERKCTDAMRAVRGYTTVAILHDEVMFARVDDTNTMLEAMTTAVQAIVPQMKVSMKRGEVPEWFSPDTHCWYDDIAEFNAIDVPNHTAGWNSFTDLLHSPPPEKTKKNAKEHDKEKIRCDDDTPYVPHAAKWGVSLIPFANTSVLAHLVAKRRMDYRVLVDDNAIQLELKYISQFSGALCTKMQCWYLRRWFAISMDGRGSVVETSSSDKVKTVMTWSQFREKYDPSFVSSTDRDGNATPYSKMVDSRRVNRVDYFPNGAPPNVLNTFQGFGVEPIDIASIPDANRADVQRGLDMVNSHLRRVICNNNEQVYTFVRNVLAHILQRRGKLRCFLQLYSKEQQTGKGIFFDDFLKRILGANFYKPSAQLCADEGLLGKFNYSHHSRLLILLDENAPFVFNKAGHGQLRTWLSSERYTYTQKNHTGMEMNDYATLISLTNELLSIRSEGRGDGRSVPIQVFEGYSKLAASEGWLVDGSPMTNDRRDEYFGNFGECALDGENANFVQSAFLYEMLQIDLSRYHFQSNIPETNLRAEMSAVADEDQFVDQFCDAWEAGELRYTYRDEEHVLGPSSSLHTAWHKGSRVWEAFSKWSHASYVNSSNTRDMAQLSLKMVARGVLGALDDEQRTNKRIGRKATGGNQRAYCCRAYSVAVAPTEFRALTTHN